MMGGLESLTYYLQMIRLIIEERKMPIYEYVCSDCDLKFELLRPLSRAGEAASCPRCHNSAERVFSTFACFSTDESGLSSPVGGSSCATCGTTSCDTCGL